MFCLSGTKIRKEGMKFVTDLMLMLIIYFICSFYLRRKNEIAFADIIFQREKTIFNFPMCDALDWMLNFILDFLNTVCLLKLS